MSDWVTVNEHDAFVSLQMDDGKANALGFDMLAGLSAGLDKAEATGKPVLIAGRPGRFSAGFDLTVMAKQDADTMRLLRAGAEISGRLFSFPVPVVAAVTGHAIAMGALLCLSVDYRIGAEGDFKIGLNEVAIGMTLPHFGIALAKGRLANEWLPRAVDLAQLFEPHTAAKVGYLDEVCSPEQLMARAEEMARGFSKLDLQAHHNTKLRTRAAARTALEKALVDDFL